ncbi:MAG: carbohydrate binding domain-containing protein [Anaerolineae bacterium]
MTSALAISYDIGAWGGFTHALSDGENWISQDWTDFNALQFSLYGNNTGGIVKIEIFDNRNPELNNDSAERWFFRITDDYEGWQEFVIPSASSPKTSSSSPMGAWKPVSTFRKVRASGLRSGC